jgi:hypothetical protein
MSGIKHFKERKMTSEIGYIFSKFKYAAEIALNQPSFYVYFINNVQQCKQLSMDKINIVTIIE